MTGNVIRFPFERRDIWSDAYHEEPAVILILPVIRVERCVEDSVRSSFDELRAAFAAQSGDMVDRL